MRWSPRGGNRWTIASRSQAPRIPTIRSAQPRPEDRCRAPGPCRRARAARALAHLNRKPASQRVARGVYFTQVKFLGTYVIPKIQAVLAAFRQRGLPVFATAPQQSDYTPRWTDQGGEKDHPAAQVNYAPSRPGLAKVWIEQAVGRGRGSWGAPDFPSPTVVTLIH